MLGTELPVRKTVLTPRPQEPGLEKPHNYFGSFLLLLRRCIQETTPVCPPKDTPPGSKKHNSMHHSQIDTTVQDALLL